MVDVAVGRLHQCGRGAAGVLAIGGGVDGGIVSADGRERVTGPGAFLGGFGEAGVFTRGDIVGASLLHP